MNSAQQTWRETRRYMDYQNRMARSQQRHEERFARQEAQRNRRFQATQSAQQMAFQERMANTAHQREIEDLRAAGINPVLTATGGSGASSPAGSAASGDSAAVQSIASAIPQMFGAAQTFAEAQVQSAKAEKEKAKAKVIYQRKKPSSKPKTDSQDTEESNSSDNAEGDVKPVENNTPVVGSLPETSSEGLQVLTLTEESHEPTGSNYDVPEAADDWLNDHAEDEVEVLGVKIKVKEIRAIYDRFLKKYVDGAVRLNTNKYGRKLNDEEWNYHETVKNNFYKNSSSAKGVIYRQNQFQSDFARMLMKR